MLGVLLLSCALLRLVSVMRLVSLRREENGELMAIAELKSHLVEQHSISCIPYSGRGRSDVGPTFGCWRKLYGFVDEESLWRGFRYSIASNSASKSAQGFRMYSQL